MNNKIIIISILCFSLILSFGCSSKDAYKGIFKGETDNWEAEVIFLEEENNYEEDVTHYYLTLRYKNDLDELTSLNNINIGYLWLIEDTEFVIDQSFSGFFDFDYDDIKENVVYAGEGKEPERLFEFFKTEMPVWEDTEDNKEYTVSFIMSDEVFENMALEIEFMVEWGNNEENFKLIKE